MTIRDFEDGEIVAGGGTSSVSFSRYSFQNQPACDVANPGRLENCTERTVSTTGGASNFGRIRVIGRTNYPNSTSILPTTILKQSFVDGAQYLLLFLSQGDHTSESKAALGFAWLSPEQPFYLFECFLKSQPDGGAFSFS